MNSLPPPVVNLQLVCRNLTFRRKRETFSASRPLHSPRPPASDVTAAPSKFSSYRFFRVSLRTRVSTPDDVFAQNRLGDTPQSTHNSRRRFGLRFGTFQVLLRSQFGVLEWVHFVPGCANHCTRWVGVVTLEHVTAIPGHTYVDSALHYIVYWVFQVDPLPPLPSPSALLPPPLPLPS